MTAARDPIPGLLPWLRRVAVAAQKTYVGRNWPSMDEMRRDGIGSGLVENRHNESKIRRYLDTFNPELAIELIDSYVATIEAEAAEQEPQPQRYRHEVIDGLDYLTAAEQGRDVPLDVERLAVVAAARRFLEAHDRVVGSQTVTRDDTFAMKNRADELRDVLRLYDENAATPVAAPEEPK